MSSSQSHDPPASDLHRTELVATAALGLLAASASMIAFATSGLLPDATPAQQLQSYAAQTQVYQEFGWAFAIFGVMSVAFVVAWGVIVRQQNLVLVSVATALGVMGLFLLAFSANFWVGTLASIQAASGSAPSMADATYQAAVANGILIYPSTFGFIAFGWGFFLLVWLIRRSGILPTWLCVIGFIGAVADGVPIGPVPDIVGNFAFVIFGFGSAVWIIYRLRVPSIPLGVVVLAIGFVLFPPPLVSRLPYGPVFGNTPIGIFLIVVGAVLIWLGWRARAPPKITGEPAHPEDQRLGGRDSSTQERTPEVGTP
jgi:Domain of unknown function (DUF4386)